MLNFSAVTDADLRRLRRRSKPDLPLEEELSPEELLAFYDRVGKLDQHKWQRKKDKEFRDHQAKVAKEIEDRNEKRRYFLDRESCIRAGIPSKAIREKMYNPDTGEEWEDPEAFENAWKAMQIPSLEPVCEDRRMLADMMDADPHKIRFDKLTDSLFYWADGNRKMTPAILSMVREARRSADPESVWNALVIAMEPRTYGGMRYGKASIYIEPGSESPSPMGAVYLPRAAANELEILRWMLKAENNELPDRVTKCEFSGESLVDRGKRHGKRYWRIAPNWQGMSLGMARLAVSYAAIVAGVAEGTLSGEAPPVVHRLAADGDAWCALAIGTKHPDFYGTAKALMAMRDGLYFSLEDKDIRSNMRGWERLAAKAVAEEDNE